MTDSQTEATKPLRVNHFHIVVPNATGAAILMLPSASHATQLGVTAKEGWQLPYARAEGIWLAETAKIISVLRASLGLDFDFTILRYVTFESSEEERLYAANLTLPGHGFAEYQWDRVLFVLEPGQPLHQPPLDGQWIDRVSLQELPLAFPDQRAPLLRYLEENEAGGIDVRRSPWARPGWFAAASAWIEEAIAEQGYSQTGAVEQLRNWSISSLLAAPTSSGRVYFKAAAALPLFVNEPALTQTLAELFPGHLPTPLKIDRDKRWMLMKDFGAVARGDKSVDFGSILAAYGKFQRESARHLDKLAAAGCIDRRLDVLAGQIGPLIADPVTQSALTPPEYEQLVALAPQLKERCARLAEYNIPATLLHGDFHLGNVTQRNPSPGGTGEIIFFDWTDAAISFPFLDHFILYFEVDDEADLDATHACVACDAVRWRDGYLAAWREFESPARLLEAWELAKPLCALHHAVSYLTIDKSIEPLTRQELFHGLPDNLHYLLGSFKS